MGIFGSGLATGVSMALVGVVDFIIILYYVHKNNVTRRFRISELFTTFNEAIPYVIRSIILWSSILVMVKVIATLGASIEAAYQIIITIWAFEEIALESLEIPLQTLIGEKIGAKDFRGAKSVLNHALKLGFKLCIGLTVAQIGLSFIIPGWFTPDTSVQYLAFIGLIESAFVFFHACFSFLMDGAFVAAGDIAFMAYMCAISAAIYVPLALLLAQFLPKNEIGILLALGTYDFIFMGARAIIAYWRYRHDRWLRIPQNAH
jgi:Na+-driven multidrug efflux pump